MGRHRARSESLKPMKPHVNLVADKDITSKRVKLRGHMRYHCSAACRIAVPLHFTPHWSARSGSKPDLDVVKPGRHI